MTQTTAAILADVIKRVGIYKGPFAYEVSLDGKVVFKSPSHAEAIAFGQGLGLGLGVNA